MELTADRPADNRQRLAVSSRNSRDHPAGCHRRVGGSREMHASPPAFAAEDDRVRMLLLRRTLCLSGAGVDVPVTIIEAGLSPPFLRRYVSV